MQKIAAIVFIKKESERIPGKNFRLFNGRPLYTIILQRLSDNKYISEILVNSDSDEILKYAKNLSKGIPIPRPDYLLGNHVSANEIIKYDISFSNSDIFFQTHCTNPLLTDATISKSIEKYFNTIPEKDSLYSVTKIQNRVCHVNGIPINYEKDKLIKTQDLDPIFYENSNFFIFSRQSFINANNNRVGNTPFLYEISQVEAIDIDIEEEFLLAELIEKNKNIFPSFFLKQQFI